MATLSVFEMQSCALGSEEGIDDAAVQELNKTVYEGKSLFEMLDQNGCGMLDRAAARYWLRGSGWCLDDHGLDALLDEALRAGDVHDEGYRYIAASEHAALLDRPTAAAAVGESPNSTPFKPAMRHRPSSLSASGGDARRAMRSPSLGRSVGSSTPHASPESKVAVPSAQKPRVLRWTLPHLIGAAMRNRHLCGPDLNALRGALLRLFRGQRTVRKAQLRQRIADLRFLAGGMTDGDLENLFSVCNIPSSTDVVDLEVLFERMMQAICQPKSEAARRRSSSRAGR
mmetsp:Transcript_4568/g.11526  ORF Transcript_4568/g.11526 Transcript_4568/m.11526 type:complete len:285 (+) Transcript_4568:140-994(+)